MKNLIQCTTVIFLLIQTICFSQTENIEVTKEKQETKTKIATQEFEGFIGEYVLEEAGFTLEIIREHNKMYIVTEFSKDILIPKNDTTLHELTRGVDLELIKNNKDALKFSQNGYVTTIKRVATITEK